MPTINDLPGWITAGGTICGGIIAWILRNEHRISRLEQAVFGGRKGKK